MTGLKAATVLFLLSAATQGSTCRGQSSGAGTGEASKETASAEPHDVTLAGVDTSALTPREKKEWSGYVSELLAPCSDVPVSIAQCVQEKRACTKCLPAARFVLKGVRDGMAREQIEKSFHNRFDADRIKNVPIDGSPTRGPDDAPVTMVEFADFECPVCVMEAPIVDKVWNEHKNQVRFVFKFLPLPMHPHGEIAARAGIAAMKQGKFWDMHAKLFANRDHLEQSDLDSYAKEIGLDLSKFHADMNSQATTDRIAQDKKLADTLEVKGTPTIFINGRDYELRQDLGEWISTELQMAGVDPSAKPAPSSAAPADAGAKPASTKAKAADEVRAKK